MYTPPHRRDETRYCEFHGDHGLDTNNCIDLRKEIEACIRNGRLSHLAKGAKAQNNIQTSGPSGITDRGKNHVEEWPRKFNVEAKAGHEILMTSMRCGSSLMTQNNHGQQTHEIAFSSHDPIPAHCNRDDPLVIKSIYRSKTIVVKFMVVQAPSPYNAILGRPRLKKLGAIASTLHALIKFPIQSGIATVRGDIPYIFAWSPADMTGIPRHLAEHKLKIHPRTFPVKQKKRVLAKDRNKAVSEEVKKLMDARILKEAFFPRWISNPVMV
ncbi:hypothetical protein Tco_0914227 [Tanacetum coccineum]